MSFASVDEVHGELGGILRGIVADEGSRTALQEADTVLRLDLTEPETSLTLRAKAGADVALDVGQADFEPEVVLAMPATTARALLAGEVNLTLALAHGDVRVKGPVAKALKVVPVLLGAGTRVEAQGAPEPSPEPEPEAPAAADAPDEPASED